MVTFRNNNNHNRRGGFRRNTRNFKSNGDTPKFNSNFSNNDLDMMLNCIETNVGPKKKGSSQVTRRLQ